MDDKQQKQAAMNLKIELGHDPDEVVDVTVTCDRTWSKQGVLSVACRVAIVTPWKSGEVLDCEVLSKRCSACTPWEGCDKNSEVYNTGVV